MSPVYSTGLNSVTEFNRRAVKALRAIELPEFGFDDRFLKNVGQIVDRNYTVTDAQQVTLYRIVHRRRAQIWDKLVTAYAAERIKEYQA